MKTWLIVGIALLVGLGAGFAVGRSETYAERLAKQLRQCEAQLDAR